MADKYIGDLTTTTTMATGDKMVVEKADGTGTKIIEFEDLCTEISDQIGVADLEEAFTTGCSTIAQAVTDNGVATAATDSPSTIATNIGQIRSTGNAAASDIRSGKTAWVNKVLVTGTGSGGGGGGGTIGGTATNADILYGKTVTLDDDPVLTGTMVDNGTVTQTLDCGQSYTIPAGKHSGSGTVTANSLASQTGVDTGKTAIDAGHVVTGYQGWVNGSKITGTYNAPVGEKTARITLTGTSAWSDYGNGSQVQVYFTNLQINVVFNTSTGTWGVSSVSGTIGGHSQSWVSGWGGDSYVTLSPTPSIAATN